MKMYVPVQMLTVVFNKLLEGYSCSCTLYNSKSSFLHLKDDFKTNNQKKK